jgi:hypothetical protein
MRLAEQSIATRHLDGAPLIRTTTGRRVDAMTRDRLLTLVCAAVFLLGAAAVRVMAALP